MHECGGRPSYATPPLPSMAPHDAAPIPALLWEPSPCKTHSAATPFTRGFFIRLQTWSFLAAAPTEHIFVCLWLPGARPGKKKFIQGKKKKKKAISPQAEQRLHSPAQSNILLPVRQLLLINEHFIPKYIPPSRPL